MRRALNKGSSNRRWLVAGTTATLAGSAAVVMGVLPVGAAEVTLQAPFACGDVWEVGGAAYGDGNGRLLWPDGPSDDTVLAMADGKVSDVQRSPLGSHQVDIRHADGSTSSLVGMETTGMKVGNTVRQGEKVGRIGESAWHWGWTKFGGQKKPWIQVLVTDADGESQPVAFDGAPVNEHSKVTSKNCPAG